jgi:predicted branched-subunit amino acid permease
VSINPNRNQVDRTALSVAFTVGLYGAAFGAAGVTAGFSILQTCLLSILLFSGASQFAVVGIMGAGGSAVSAIATATLLGFRNALYGLQMAPILKVKGLKRILAAQRFLRYWNWSVCFLELIHLPWSFRRQCNR